MKGGGKTSERTSLQILGQLCAWNVAGRTVKRERVLGGAAVGDLKEWGEKGGDSNYRLKEGQ